MGSAGGRRVLSGPEDARKDRIGEPETQGLNEGTLQVEGGFLAL